MLIINGINQHKPTSGFVIVTSEPVFYKIHYLCSNPILRALKVNAHTKTPNKHSRISTTLLTVWNMEVEFSSGMILKMCCLNTGIGESNHANYFCDIFAKHPTISLTHKFLLIGYSIIGEEIIEVFVATSERLTIIKNLLSYSCQLTLFFKNEITIHHFSQGNLNSRICFIVLAIRSSRSGDRRGAGFFSCSSALRMKSSAISPERMGTALIGIAISKML